MSLPLTTVCVVSHTHWDREWYRGSGAFRQRLVALVDALLEPGPSVPFLLDGQGITLRDYLAVRPERFAALSTALREGRLEAGPWFVLADNLIPSGEAMIRNLEAGQRVLQSMGANAPRVAYCPDTFGHPAALPTIAHGFGLPVAIVWRGAGGATHPDSDAFWWCGPDGARVLVQHLPPDGYEFGSALPTDPEAAAARWGRLSTLWQQRGATGVALLLNGADHHARQPDTLDAVRALGAVAGSDVAVGSCTLQDWATRYAAAASDVALPEVRGELRNSYGYTWTLGGTLATRAHQKRANARLERGLLRDVEPWLALARLHDVDGTHRAVSPNGRVTMAQLPVLLDRAWEELLATHPHDTLCGCSIDAVARAMDAQQERVAEQGRGLRESALQLALGYDPVAMRAVTDGFNATRVVIRNRTARARGGLATLILHDTIADAPAGPGSADTPARQADPHAPSPVLGAWVVQPNGPPRITHVRRESPQHYPDNDLVREHRVLAWVPPVPAFGVMALDASHMTDAPPPAAVRATTRGERIQIDNGFVCVSVTIAGGVTIRCGERQLRDALALETQADEGDSYTPAPRGHPQRLALERVRLRESGPLRASIELHWRQPNAATSGTHAGSLRVVTTLSITAGSSVVACRVRGWNRRTNRRLRLVWNTDVVDGATIADAALGPVRREPIEAPSHAREAVPDGMPLHRWLMHVNDTIGATLISDGLAEGAVHERRLAVTLLRSVGQLSRPDLSERPGHAGWPEDIPAAQCQGEFTANVGLLLHGPLSGPGHGQGTWDLVREAVDDLLLPLLGESWRDLDVGPSPRERIGPALHGAALEASAITVSHRDPQAIVLRAVNWSEHATAGHWQMPDDGPWEVTPCRLDEMPLDGTEAKRAVTLGRLMPFDIGPRGVITLRVRRASAAR